MRWTLLLIFCLVSCQKESTPKELSVPVTAFEIQPQDIEAVFEFVAVAESSHIVELRARVEGYLEKICYEEGELVHAGDLMFVLDQRSFIAKVEEAQGELDRQKAMAWNALQQKNRMVPLYEENAVSQRDLDNAISKQLSTEADVVTAQANLRKAEVNLSYTEIKSPVTGLASRAIFREGALISPGPNSLLTNIYVIDPIWVNFSVSEGDILKARQEQLKGTLVMPKDKGFQIEIVMPDGSILPAKGKIDFTDPALQQSTGTMLVRSIMANPKGWLRPGQFVRARILGAYRPSAIIVPKTAVLQGRNGLFVYLLKDDKALVQPVETGDWYEDYWIITKGLKAGDRVISKGVNKVQQGSEVKVTKSDAYSAKKQPHILVYDQSLLH